jgi:predicted GTPase
MREPMRRGAGHRRILIAGEGGSVLVTAASSDAVALACEGLAGPTKTPSGLPVFPADRIPADLDVDSVRLLPCESATAAAIEAWAESRSVPIAREAVPVFSPPDGIRVVAVSSATTGSGKTALTRRVARALLRSSVRVACARHPIASLLLWDRFDASVVSRPDALSAPRPLEEREELAPLVGAGIAVATGLDPESVLRAAANEAGDGGVVVWDGGGAAKPWVEPDLHLVAVDLLRPPPVGADEHIATADIVVMTKADSAPANRTQTTEEWVREANPDAQVILADLAVGVSAGGELADKRVVIVEDAPSLVLGGLAAGAGAVAARRFRCGVVDPRPFAVGAIAETLSRQPHIGAVIPSLGRTPEEIEDFVASVVATPGDAVLWASNADPTTILTGETRPVVRAYGELTEVAGPALQEVLAPLLPGHQ